MAHNFKKQFGQNFLRGDRFAKMMVDALELTENELAVEIGPGDGRVTNLLLETGAKVVSVEVDYDLIPNLIKRFGDNTSFELVHKDVMQVDPTELKVAGAIEGHYKMAGSLPYNISKQIILKFVTGAYRPQKMSFIVQEEVAQEYVARAPQASFLSNWIHLFANVKKLQTIPAAQFFPQPKVNGAILVITPHDDFPDAAAREELKKIIEIGFRSPRKTLRNNLSNVWDGEKVGAALTTLGLSATARAAELTHENWANLLPLLK